MARYLFSGRFDDLYVVPDSGLGGALKAAPGANLPTLYNAPKHLTRSAVSDYLVVDLDTGTTSATSVITTDSVGYPPPFYGPDGVANLYDLAGHKYVGQLDTGDITLPLADETLAGIAEFASVTEAPNPAVLNRIISPRDLAAGIATHDDATDAHTDIRDLVAANITAINAKADLDAGFVRADQIDSSTSATADSLVKRTSGGQVATATATSDDQAVPYLQMNTAINNAAAIGADVRDLEIASGSLPLSVPTPAGTFVAVPGVVITNAASGQLFLAEYTLMARGLSAAGLQVRHKSNTSAVTNKLANPSFEVNTNNWTTTASTAIARATTGGGQDGSAYATLTAVTAANSVVTSEWTATTPGTTWTAGAYFKSQTGTPRVSRVDIQFGDAAQVAISGSGTVLGTGTTPTTGAWSQSVAGGAGGSTAPTGTAWVRARIVIQTPAVSDVTRVDAIQLEPSAPLPAFGATGGGGSSALEVTGYWRGLTNAGTTSDNYSKVTPIRYPADANLTSAHGLIDASTDVLLTGSFRIAVVGTGLTNQRIELEVSQRVSNATATTIVAGYATFAEIS